MAGFSTANIRLGSVFGAQYNGVNTKDTLSISNDGKSVSLFASNATTGNKQIVSVLLDTPYDILSTNTNVILRSMTVVGVAVSAPTQILQDGRVVKLAYDYNTSSPESPTVNYENYRGFSNYPYGGLNSPYGSTVPKSRNWYTYKYYTQGPYYNPPPPVDQLIFSNDGRYSVYKNPTSNVISVLKLVTPFDTSTYEIYDQIEFSNVNGVFPASLNMLNNNSQYKVFHYDQENDKIFLYRQIYTYPIINIVVSLVEIS
jgi:hypothetical protein